MLRKAFGYKGEVGKRDNVVAVRLTDKEAEVLDKIREKRLISRSLMMRIALREFAQKQGFSFPESEGDERDI